MNKWNALLPLCIATRSVTSTLISTRNMFGFFRGVLDWLNAPPRLTRWLLVPTLLVPFLCRFGFVNPYLLIHDWSMLWWPRFQFWRMITPLFCSPFGIQLLFTCYFRYQCLSQMELGSKKPARIRVLNPLIPCRPSIIMVAGENCYTQCVHFSDRLCV